MLQDSGPESEATPGGVEAEHNTIDELPAGWLRSVSYRTSGSKRKKDTHYIHPESRYEFITLKDVFRYLETGDVLKCRTRPRKRTEDEMKNIVTEDCLPSVKSKSKLMGASKERASRKNTKQATKIEGASEDESESDTKVNQTSIGAEDFLEAYEKRKSVAEIPLVNGVQQQASLKHVKAERTKKNPPEKSKRQQKLVEDTEDAPMELMNMKQQNPKKHGRSKWHRKDDKPASEEPSLELEDSEIHFGENERKTRAGSKKTKAMQAAIVSPLRASKRLADLKAKNPVDMDAFEQPGNSTTGVSGKESDPKTETSSSLTQENGVSMLDFPNPGSSLLSLFGGSWPDPCIEFAFKTLTGDLPVLKEAAAIEEYFRQQLGSKKIPSKIYSAPPSKCLS